MMLPSTNSLKGLEICSLLESSKLRNLINKYNLEINRIGGFFYGVVLNIRYYSFLLLYQNFTNLLRSQINLSPRPNTYVKYPIPATRWDPDSGPP